MPQTSGVDLFLTHDRRLHKLTVPGLPFIAGWKLTSSNSSGVNRLCTSLPVLHSQAIDTPDYT